MNKFMQWLTSTYECDKCACKFGSEYLLWSHQAYGCEARKAPELPPRTPPDPYTKLLATGHWEPPYSVGVYVGLQSSLCNAGIQQAQPFSDYAQSALLNQLHFQNQFPARR